LLHDAQARPDVIAAVRFARERGCRSLCEVASTIANIAWPRRLFEDAKQFSPGGAYYNFPGFLEEGDELLAQSFGSNYTRIREVKTKYDPDNVSQYNLKIPINRQPLVLTSPA
jgi:hypothetical protein